MVEPMLTYRRGGNVHSLEPEVFDTAPCFLERLFGVAQVNGSNSQHPASRLAAEVGQPVIIRPPVGGGRGGAELWHGRGVQAHRGVDHHIFDTGPFHCLSVHLRRKTSTSKVFICITQAREEDATLAELLAEGHSVVLDDDLDAKAQRIFLVVNVGAGHFRAELRVQVPLPNIRWLENMGVTVDKLIAVVHTLLLVPCACLSLGNKAMSLHRGDFARHLCVRWVGSDTISRLAEPECRES